MPDTPEPRKERLFLLGLGALGVVYGDIGTSPLYAIRECFHGVHSTTPVEANVLGVLSLVFWSLTVVVGIQYLGILLRTDNRGEGGIFALLALVPTTHRSRSVRVIIGLAMLGAALLYGDGMITPAISVLSAVEGLSTATHAAEPYVVPIAAGVLVILFLFQRRGTMRVGRLFGPVMTVWFLAIAAAGLPWVVSQPRVLGALSPHHAVRFLLSGDAASIGVLASVVLVITGAEAVYADMGHFGRRPIRRAWFAVVFPALLLNYFGQGALLLDRPEAVENPFYGLVPSGLVLPMVGLATVAAVVASQAMISGAFSLTRQAVQLGYLPRVRILHTSSEVEGQIFVPVVNRALMVLCVVLVLAFGGSSGLAGAYGIAVTGAMSITAIVYFFVLTRRRGWSRLRAGALTAAFLVFPVGFLLANTVKLDEGGWFPLVVAAAVFTLMSTWDRGRELLSRRTTSRRTSLETFQEDLHRSAIHRVPGTAVFMTSTPDYAPSSLLHQIKHNKVLHETLVVASVRTENVPTWPRAEQVEWKDLGGGFHRVVARYGFMQVPDVPDALRRARLDGLPGSPQHTTYFMGRETVVAHGSADMPRWRKGLFSFLGRNSLPAVAYFRLPPERVVEIGTLVEL